MKTNIYIILFISLMGMVFYSCDKEENIISQKPNNETVDEFQPEIAYESALSDDLQYSKQVIVYNDNKKASAKIIVSSDCEEILEYHLNAYDMTIAINGEVNLNEEYVSMSSKNEAPSYKLKDMNQSELDQIQGVFIEILEVYADVDVEQISVMYIRNLDFNKAIPDNYFFGIKVKIDDFKYLGIRYIPKSYDNDGIQLKFGYTRTWLSRWIWAAWYYHPATNQPWQYMNQWSNTDNRRIGAAVVSNYQLYDNFTWLMSNTSFPVGPQ